MGFYQNDATAASNTSINSIAMAGSSTPANLDNAIRELAAQGKQFAKDLGGPTATGTADALVVALNDTALTAYYDGLIFGCIIALDSTSTAPQINVNSIGAKTIYKSSAGVQAALAAGDMQAGQFVIFRYRSAWGGTGGFEVIRFDADLPQSLGTGDSPTFTDLTVSDDLTVGDDILLASGAVINWNSGDALLTHSADTLQVTGAGWNVIRAGATTLPPLYLSNTSDSATVAVAFFDGDRATPTDGDAIRLDYRLSDSAGTQTVFARETITAVDVTDATEDGKVSWSVMKAGTLTEVMSLDPTNGLIFSNGTPGIKAFCRFNGTGTPAIAAGFNVASITDNGTGDYTLNFTTALADTNYTVIATSKLTNNTNFQRVYPAQPCAYATGSIRILTGAPTSGSDTDPAAEDHALINVVVYGT
jgi:hypothetical protein